MHEQNEFRTLSMQMVTFKEQVEIELVCRPDQESKRSFRLKVGRERRKGHLSSLHNFVCFTIFSSYQLFYATSEVKHEKLMKEEQNSAINLTKFAHFLVDIFIHIKNH